MRLRRCDVCMHHGKWSTVYILNFENVLSPPLDLLNIFKNLLQGTDMKETQKKYVILQTHE
jgi:hypothetical protein